MNSEKGVDCELEEVHIPGTLRTVAKMAAKVQLSVAQVWMISPKNASSIVEGMASFP